MKKIGNSEISFEVANNFTEKNLLCLRVNIKGKIIGTLLNRPDYIGECFT